ncbi:MAG: RsmD family RNA methyltransferase, partial [Nitrospirota bacterium]
ALFNILGDRLPGSAWLDLYAGSGIIGLEALCRGAARATFVEAHPEACRCIAQNIAALGYGEQADIRCEPVHRFFRSSGERPARRFDVIFADPPYDERRRRPFDELLLLCRRNDMITPRARLIIEHSSAAPTPSEGHGWRRARTYTYGDSALTFYDPADAVPDEAVPRRHHSALARS